MKRRIFKVLSVLLILVIFITIMPVSNVLAADVTIESSAYGAIGSTTERAGIFWRSIAVGYVIFADVSLDLNYRKTIDGGATWGNQVEITTNGVIALDCWADWQTPGDAGTKIHIAYLDYDADDIMYVNLETATDTLSTPDVIADAGGDGTIYTGAGIYYNMISICKAIGGNIDVAYKHRDNSSAYAYGFYTSPDGDNWTSEASPWEADNLDYIQLYSGNETDTQDIWAAFWDANANEISLKTYDDSGDSWSETTISGAGNAIENLYRLQMDGQIRHSDKHLIFSFWNDFDTATADLKIYDINGAGSITPKTDIIQNESENACVSIIINQVNDDIYVYYTQGTAMDDAVDVVYKKSEDGGTNWGSETAFSDDDEEDYRWISAGCMSSAWDGKAQPVFFDDDDDDLFTNFVNGINLSSAPIVTTQAASSIGVTTATGNGNITATGGENADHRGVVWDDATHGDPGDTAPNLTDYVTAGGGYVDEAGDFGTGAFTASMTGLPADTTIYYRAYAHNSGGYSYGDEVFFDTLPEIKSIMSIAHDDIGKIMGIDVP